MRWVLRDAEPFLGIRSRSRIDFVGEEVGDLAVERDEDEVFLFSLVSGSFFFFLGDDLVKRPIGVNK